MPCCEGTVSKVMHAAGALSYVVLGKVRPDDERKRIRDICDACEHETGTNSLRRCKICSCFILPKAASPTEECPIGNW
jgi:predicted MarR family transcription regulator